MARVYGSNPNHWQAYCDYSTSSSETATTITISAAGFRSVAWGFSISSAISCTAACTGQSSKTGSGGFSSGYGETVEKSYVSGSWTVARTTSAQTLTVTVTVTNTSGYMNGTSTLSFQVTVPALSSYAVSYNANGGSGAPAAQTKWYGTALKLSSAVPTRSGYNFKGWATSASGSAAYQPGGSYTANAAATLYAVWQLAYQAPTISSCSAARCNSSGTAADGGTYAKVTAKWAVSTAYNSSNKATSLKVEYRKKGATSWTSGSTQNPNAASGTLSVVVGGGNLTADDQWEFRVTVTDSGGSSTATCSVAGQYYPMDIGNKGKTIAFGKAASATAGLEVGMAARFDSTITVSTVQNSSSASPKLGTKTVGGSVTPVYLNAGTPTACSAATVKKTLSYGVRVTISPLARTVTVDMAGAQVVTIGGANGGDWKHLVLGTIEAAYRPPYTVRYPMLGIYGTDNDPYFEVYGNESSQPGQVWAVNPNQGDFSGYLHGAGTYVY